MYAWAANGRAGPGEFHHLYGTRRPAAIHVGMSPDCRKLGLGVQEISISAGTGADVMASGAVILSYHSKHVYVYTNLVLSRLENRSI